MPTLDDIYNEWRGELFKPLDEISIDRVAELETAAHSRGASLIDILASGALVAAPWDGDLHPRGKDGRFIELMGWVNVHQGFGDEDVRGQVTDISPDPAHPGKPKITVEFKNAEGKSIGSKVVTPDKITSAAPQKARLDDVPDPSSEKRQAVGGRDWPTDMYGNDLEPGMSRVDEDEFEYVTDDGRTFTIDDFAGGMAITETTDGENTDVPTLGMTVPEDASTAIDDFVQKNPLPSMDEEDDAPAVDPLGGAENRNDEDLVNLATKNDDAAVRKAAADEIEKRRTAPAPEPDAPDTGDALTPEQEAIVEQHVERFRTVSGHNPSPAAREMIIEQVKSGKLSAIG